MKDEVAPRPLRQQARRVDAEPRRDRFPSRVDVDELQAPQRERTQQRGDRSSRSCRSDDRDPIAEARVPRPTTR